MKTDKIARFLLMGAIFIVASSCENGDDNGLENENVPVLSTIEVTEITKNTATSGGNITDDGGATVTARGVCWSTNETPTIDDNKTEDGAGAGSFTSSITDLIAGTTYYVRAYATNSTGTAYGNEVFFSTAAMVPFPFNTVIGANGKIWMDRNLGATQVATSSNDPDSYGDLYQWGRGTDGHQLRTSPTTEAINTETLSSTNTPAHGNFILSNTAFSLDWRNPQNDNLWQGVNGVNNPCPSGYRLPTAAELDAERLSWSTNNAAGAFASPLKLPMPGQRAIDGVIGVVGSGGYYWSSTVSSIYSSFLYISPNSIIDTPTPPGIYRLARASGRSVRCIKD